jgi:DNA-binding winged helix-turn-helix (wHTH) protein/tetratricopeptide (TPR) repeat protein
MISNAKHFYEFGPFRLDPNHRQLLRENQPVPLQPKAFDILLALVENSERVVLKDDLMKMVWPGTFVEEANLAQNISVLRRILGEAAGENRYIVTLPGRGYQFVSHVKALGPDNLATSQPADRGNHPTELSFQRQTIRANITTQEEHSAWQRRTTMLATALTLLALGVVVGYSLHRARRQEKSATVSSPASIVKSRRAVAVLGFRDLSGRPEDAWLSTALAEMLNTELAAGEKLRLIPGEDVARARLDLLVPDAETLSGDTLARLRKSLGTDLVVLGSYASLGGKSKGRIRVDLRIQDAIAGETIAEVATTGEEDDLFELVSRSGNQLRETLGLSGVSLAEAMSVKASLPTNPEAARLYAEGVARLRVFDALAARDLLQQAVAIDKKYPLSRTALAASWAALGYDKKAREEAAQAFQLSANLSREERLVVEGDYHLSNHEYDKAIDVYRTLFTLFPDNLDYGLRLADAQQRGSKSNDALTTVMALRKLPSPESSDPRVDLQEATSWIWISNSQRAQGPLKRALEEARSQGSRLLAALVLRWQCRSSFILGHVSDAVAACREARDSYAAAGDRAGEATVMRLWADALRGYDAPGPSRVREVPPDVIELYRQALDVFHSIGNENGMANTMNSLGLLHATQGDFSAAEKMHREALTLYERVANTASAGVVVDNLGDDRVLQGDLRGAMARYEEALVLDRKVGDAGAAAGAVYGEANVDMLRGDLTRARMGLEESIKQWKNEEDSYDSGYGHFSLAEVLLAEADFAGARQALEQSLAIRKRGENKILLAETQLELAELSLQEGLAPSGVEAAVRQAVETFKEESARDDESLAWGLLARTLFAQKKFEEAKEAASQAMVLSAKSRFELRAENAITATRTQALGRSISNPAVRSHALGQLTSVLFEAKRRGYFGVELQVRLLVCELEAADDAALASLHRKALEGEARSRGFELVARKAHSLTLETSGYAR